jgi:hypothetical protein
MVICRLKDENCPANKSSNTIAVVIEAPTATTNMTGFFISVTGFSFINEPLMAVKMISRVNNRVIFLFSIK